MSGSIVTKEGEPEAGPAARAGWTSASYPVLCNSEAAQGKQMHVMRMYSDAGIGSSHHESPRILFSTPDLLKAFTYLWPLGSKGWDVNRPDSETPDFSVPCFCIIPKKYSWFTNSGVHGTLLFNILGNKLSLEYFISVSKIRKNFSIKNSGKICLSHTRLDSGSQDFIQWQGVGAGPSVICLITTYYQDGLCPWLYRPRLGHPLTHSRPHMDLRNLCAKHSWALKCLWSGVARSTGRNI